jgi:hypothetical protein
MDNKEIVEHLADPWIEHADVEKCGQCLKARITAEVAKRHLEAGKYDVDAVFKESDALWRESALYKRVKALLDQGIALEAISEQLSEEGIDI